MKTNRRLMREIFDLLTEAVCYTCGSTKNPTTGSPPVCDKCKKNLKYQGKWSDENPAVTAPQVNAPTPKTSAIVPSTTLDDPEEVDEPGDWNVYVYNGEEDESIIAFTSNSKATSTRVAKMIVKLLGTTLLSSRDELKDTDYYYNGFAFVEKDTNEHAYVSGWAEVVSSLPVGGNKNSPSIAPSIMIEGPFHQMDDDGKPLTIEPTLKSKFNEGDEAVILNWYVSGYYRIFLVADINFTFVEKWMPRDI